MDNQLSTASAKGDLAAVRLLIQNGADVNSANKFGRTPIQVVKLACPAVAKALLVAGANPNVPDTFKNLTIAHDTAREGFADMMKMLLLYGADVNLEDDDGNLPLHLAQREGHFEVVKLLSDLSTRIHYCHSPEDYNH
ncbi:cyclin-dependent kinase 4 inhibitor C [Aplochiton taeniatus]